MTVSLNQIDQTSRKAARGAGLPWGLADDVGRAVRWLHTYGLNGAPALADWLDRRADYDYPALAPQSVGRADIWRAPGGTLDPLVTGATLGDCIESANGAPIETAAIAHPLLAAGFIGNLAEIEDLAFTLDWPQVTLHCRRGELWLTATQTALQTQTAKFLRCHQAPPPHAPPSQRHTPHIGEVTLAPKAWTRLNHHARRTYVEATEASRLAGAGAGLHDND